MWAYVMYRSESTKPDSKVQFGYETVTTSHRVDCFHAHLLLPPSIGCSLWTDNAKAWTNFWKQPASSKALVHVALLKQCHLHEVFYCWLSSDGLVSLRGHFDWEICFFKSVRLASQLADIQVNACCCASLTQAVQQRITSWSRIPPVQEPGHTY